MDSIQPQTPYASNATGPTAVEKIQTYLDELSVADEPDDALQMHVTIRLGGGSCARFIARSEADWDAAASEFEYVFSRRFGVSWSRGDRALLLACKRKYRLTDEEIRTLLRARAIQRRRDEALLAVDRSLPIAGYCHIMSLTVLLVPLALSVLMFRQLPTAQVLVAMGCGLVLGAMMRVIYHTHLEPWKIFRRATH